MKFVRFIIPVLFFVVLSSCSEDEPKKKASGYFKLAQIQSSASRHAARLNATEETTFDLGTIKASREFYFLLANGGKADITNVELTTNNPAFIISPASISLLPSPESDSESLVPLISLGIEHGPKLNGIGYTDLLPMGENVATLTISGSTVENGETIQLESTFTISVDVKTMDITIYSDDDEINYNNSLGQWTGLEHNSGLPAIPSYFFNPENFKVKNTGNTNITVNLLHLSSENQSAEFELAPNETKTVMFPALVNSSHHLSLITIDGDGTVTDRTRVKQGVDGKGYILVENPTPE